MARTSDRLTEWLRGVYEIKGTSPFAVSELPDHLYTNTIQTKCKGLGLLRKTGKVNNSSCTWKWEITPRGECIVLGKSTRGVRAERTLSYNKRVEGSPGTSPPARPHTAMQEPRFALKRRERQGRPKDRDMEGHSPGHAPRNKRQI